MNYDELKNISKNAALAYPSSFLESQKKPT
jgi:hypothetical protein